ncbi:MAG TPA: DNA-processing protein DprA, partial [Gemmatimonadaceae bacterium]|nr:DNA-processing protein DprA [Gemmatimonadaceae bacterium]
RGVGRSRYRELVDRFGTPEAALASLPPTDEETRREASVLLDDASRVGARVEDYGAPGYPPALRDLSDPPPLLFGRGHVEWLLAETPVVAIVGTRTATAYGERIAKELAAAFARAGAVVISGMARGVDASAHLGALAAGGRTAAVLGTGIDIAYPAAHRTLHGRLATEGVLFSELPPGERANGGSFPDRNRIIAALASLTIVVEAGHRSGALITAAKALELGRHVAAVPGPIDALQSAGSNQLLRDGAQVIASVEDAIALAGLTRPLRAPEPSLAGPDRAVWDALAGGAADVDTLATATALPAREIMAALTRLELTGAVECALTGEVRRRL